MLTKSYKLGTVFGIDLEFTRGWVVIAALFIISFSSVQSYDRYITAFEYLFPAALPVAFPSSIPFMVLFSVSLVIGVYLSVLLHEYGHSVAAQALGIGVERIRLWVAGGVAQIETLPPYPRKEFAIAISGPIVTLMLIPPLLIASFVAGSLGFGVIRWFFLILAFINIVILGVNCLPVLPLDGGRIFRSILTTSLSYRRSTQVSIGVSLGFGILASAIAAYFLEPFYIIFIGIIGMLTIAERKETLRKFNPDQHLTEADEFYIYEQSFALDPTLPLECQSQLRTLIESHGGSVSEVTDSTDIIVTDNPSSISDNVTDLSSGAPIGTVEVNTLLDRFELIGGMPDEDGFNMQPRPALRQTQINEVR